MLVFHWCFQTWSHLTVRYGFRASHEAFDLSALNGPGTWDFAAGPSPTAVVHRVDGKVLIRNVSFPAPREQAALGLQQIGVIFPLEPWVPTVGSAQEIYVEARYGPSWRVPDHQVWSAVVSCTWGQSV